MNRMIFITIALTCVAAAALAQQTTTATTRRSSREQPTSQRNYVDRYGLLEQRNIFLRDRSKPTTQRSGGGSASTQPARRPEQMLVVTGIVLEDGGFRAYVEDTSATPPKILRVSPGDNLGPGRVLEIQIDAIAYEQAGQHKWIDVGSDLTGQALGTPTLTDAAATTAPADEALMKLDPNDPNLTVEQRMRIRSLQQRRGQ